MFLTCGGEKLARSDFMARPKRIDLPDSLYFVHSRTDKGESAFADQKDRENFLMQISKCAGIYSFRVHAWCLMRDHFLLLLESTNRPGLSEFMRRLLTAYTVYFNRRHGRDGNLFHGRYKSYLVDKTDCLTDLSRHVHLAPAGGHYKADPFSYKSSSLQYYMKRGEPDFLFTQDILSHFRGRRDDKV